jgi:hypothetical protein
MRIFAGRRPNVVDRGPGAGEDLIVRIVLSTAPRCALFSEA